EKRATHLWLTFRHHAAARDTHSRIVFALLSETAGGRELDRYDVIVGGCGEELLSVVLPIRNLTATGAWLGLHNAFTETSYGITDLQLRWVASDRPIPVAAGGVKYIEEGGDRQHAQNIAEAVEHLVFAYPEYRQSAAELAVDWARFHSAETLVAQLQGPPPRLANRLPPHRFAAREWGRPLAAIMRPEIGSA